MELNIKNKVALVTGGIQGIGSNITENLLKEGVKVIAAVLRIAFHSSSETPAAQAPYAIEACRLPVYMFRALLFRVLIRLNLCFLANASF